MLASDGGTVCEPLDIPLPRSGKGLVEVVCVEDRRALVREAKAPKLDRWASPPRCTGSRGVGVGARSAAMMRAVPR